jgi:hypothetical protein
MQLTELEEHMTESRRGFMITAVSAVIVSGFSRLASGMSSRSTSTNAVVMDRTIETLLSTDLAELQEQDFPGMKWQRPMEALPNIFSNLGLRADLYSTVDYQHAGGCRGNFESLEADWRPHFHSFSKVQRPYADRDVAYLMASNFNGAAVGATQYRSNPAVSLRDDEPGVALAASLLLGDTYGFSQREVAQSLAVTRKEYLTPVVNGQSTPVHRYETPSISYVHYPRHRRFPKGVVIAHNKRDSQNRRNLYGVGLYV